MQTIVFATHNQNKMKEIKNIIKNIPGMENIRLISMAEAGITEDIVENGSTYEENALIKAKYVCERTGMIALADDSGTEIDALDGQPGIYSARFLGEDTPHDVKNAYILGKLKDLPDERRKARYMCCIAAAFPDGTTKTTMGTLPGIIAHEVSEGTNGFAYDPIMYIPEFGKTMADMTMEEKNNVSHRGQALRRMSVVLLNKLKDK